MHHIPALVSRITKLSNYKNLESDMSKRKVIVTRKWPAEVEAKLMEQYDVQLNEQDTPLSQEELKAAMRTADAVLPTVTDSFTADVLDVDPLKAKILGNFGVGFDHIDIEIAKTRGITVTNTPEVLTDCTADIALTLMLMASRRAGEGERLVRDSRWTGWRPTFQLSTKFTGKTLGLVGMGRIGFAVAQRAHFGFGLNILFSDPKPPPAAVTKPLRAKHCEFHEVLRNADIVSLHCPGGSETHHLIDSDAFTEMKSGAILVNTARGDIVDSDALIAALRKGEIAAAGLDVYENEPSLNADFLRLENVVLLPHIGSGSRETRISMGYRVLENLQSFFAGDKPQDKVA